jgi:hypothetical protein
MITRIVKIALHLSSIKINGIFLKSSLDKFTEMRYNVLPYRCRVRPGVKYICLIYLLVNDRANNRLKPGFI